jgi:hypothetical protein
MKEKENPAMVPGLFRIAVGIVTLFGITACAGSPAAREFDFSGVLGKAWRLAEIRIETGGIRLDRAAMEADGLGDAFTLTFEDEKIGGAALPNRYFGPYTRNGRDLTFGRIASTLMASFKELDVLKEREYFDYLDRVQRWAWDGDRLELHSTAPDGRGAVLIFTAPAD